MHAATAAADAVDVQPAAKKLKTADCGTADVIRQSLLSDDSRRELRTQHDSAGPYTHVVLKDLVNDKLLRAVRDEVIHNISATYKETDLFKVFQTGRRQAAVLHELLGGCAKSSSSCNSLAGTAGWLHKKQQQQQQQTKGQHCSELLAVLH
jgi:hypothetical protein